MHKYSHSEIVDYVSSLTPKLSGNKNPEGVLLKYAKDHNLPGSVLQKMAQVYNTAKTINFMDKSDERGGSFYVLDTEKLIDAYENTDDLKLNKKASTTEEIEEINSFYSFYDELYNDEIKKSASSYPVYENPKVIFKEKNERKLEQDLLEEIILENKSNIGNCIEKIAEEARGLDGINFPELERQIRVTYGDESKSFIDDLASSIGEYNVPIKRADELYIEKSGSYIRNEHTLLNLVESIIESQNIIKVASTKTPPAPPFSVDNDGKALFNKPQHKLPKVETKPLSIDEVGDAVFGNKKPSDEGIIESSLKSINDTADSLAKNIGGASGKINEEIVDNLFLYKGNGSNDLQKAIDNSILQENQEIAFNTLMLTDPVLEDADEEIMREVFDAIKDISPTIASNKVRLRAVLREASQYDSVSPFMLKSLIEFEINKNRNSELENKLKSDKYRLPK